jgi:mannose-6-phosphate isomerase-like protein (cupin superfamily)
MSNPSHARYGAIHLTDVAKDPGTPDDPRDAAFHLVRRHFDVQAFGVNGVSGNAGQVLVAEHHERDDPENGTQGHEELFVVVSGRATFTIDGEELDASAGMLVFVRDPAALRSARATEDATSILVIGGRPGVAYSVSPWEQWIP